jgi:hypothetical protein
VRPAASRSDSSAISRLATICRDDVQPPLLKLFEFLVASFCLFLIEDDEPIPPRDEAAYAFATPQQLDSKAVSATPSWWTLDVPTARATKVDSLAHVAAYDLLCVCLTIQIPQAWKIVQLALLTMWNIAARSPDVESQIVAQGVAIALMDIASARHWPHSLRHMAASFLSSVHRSHSNSEHIGGLVPLCATYVTLLRSEVCPLLL